MQANAFFTILFGYAENYSDWLWIFKFYAFKPLFKALLFRIQVGRVGKKLGSMVAMIPESFEKAKKSNSNPESL